MGDQVHRRLPQEFVETVVAAFNEPRLSEPRACELLGLHRAQLYTLRKRWLRCQLQGPPFALWSRVEGTFHQLPGEGQAWLHEQLRSIRQEADTFRSRFTFASISTGSSGMGPMPASTTGSILGRMRPRANASGPSGA